VNEIVSVLYVGWVRGGIRLYVVVNVLSNVFRDAVAVRDDGSAGRHSVRKRPRGFGFVYFRQHVKVPGSRVIGRREECELLGR